MILFFAYVGSDRNCYQKVVVVETDHKAVEMVVMVDLVVDLVEHNSTNSEPWCYTYNKLW